MSREVAASMAPVRTLRKLPQLQALTLARAEPIGISAEQRTTFWDLSFVSEGSRTESETTHPDTQVSEEGGGKTLRSSSLPVVRWQAALTVLRDR